MFGSISPYKQLQSPKADNKKPIEEIRRIRSGLSTSPRGLTSPSKQGKKIEETGPVHIEVTQEDHSDRPRFPIRIPVEQMKPKRDYLAQVRKSDTTLDSRPSTAKQSKTEVYTKSGPRRTAETAKGRSPKDVKSLNKRNSMSRNEKPKQAGNLGNTAVDAQDLKKIIENIVDYKFRTYAGASNRALETQKSASNLSMDMSMRKRPNSSRRPMSSRASNKKSKNTASIHRAASSKKEPKETEYSRMSQLPQEPIDPEEAKKERLQRTKKIVIENLQKFSKEQKEKEQKKIEEDQGKTLKKEDLKKMNERIRMKNEISPPGPVQKSLSPVKHKYEWGADQKRLEMKPERKQSAKKWEKKDPEVRRQEIGLAHLSNLEELALKKAKIESKEKAEKIMKEAEEKYKLTRKEKTTDEKEKLKLLVHEQIEKKKKEKLDEKAKQLREKELKKQKLEALFKNVAEIQAKDLAEKKEAEKNKPKKPVKKKSKKTRSEQIGSTSSLPDEEDISNVNRGRAKRKSEGEEDYEEEIVEEEAAGELRELNEDDLYLLDELFEKLDIRIEEELVKGGFKKLKAYCFSEQMNRKITQEKAAIQQQQKREQQQQQQQAQLKQQQQQQQQQQAQLKQQQQQQKQTQQTAKEKVSFAATYVEPEKMSSQKQRLVESEKKQQKVFAQVNDFDVEDNEEEEQEAYITKPLKESNNYSKGLPPKQSIAEKGKQRSDTSGKKMDYRDDREEGTGYRIYNPKSAEKYKNQMMKENTRKDEDVKIPEGVDFDEMLFNLSSEELIKLPYFSIVK